MIKEKMGIGTGEHKMLLDNTNVEAGLDSKREEVKLTRNRSGSEEVHD